MLEAKSIENYIINAKKVYILKNESKIVEAPIINHTDLELIMLEKFVFRKPPFVGEDGKVKGGFY